MFKRRVFKSNFIIFRVVLSVLLILLSANVFAQESSDATSSQWYICEIKSKKKANENKYFGPYSDKETALANWIYRDLQENKKYCIAIKLVYMTATPSSYFGREYKAVKDDYNFDRDYFIKKYGIQLDDKVEAAYLKSQGKKVPKAEKTTKAKEKTETPVVEKTEKKEKTSKTKSKVIKEIDTSSLSESELAKQNALIAKQKAKDDANQAAENAKAETEKTKENKSISVENNKESAIQSAEELKLQSKEILNSSKTTYTEEKIKAKAESDEAKQLAKENGASDLYTLPETLDQFYKKEKRDALAKQIKKEAEKSAKKEPAEVVIKVEDPKNVEINVIADLEIPGDYKNEDANTKQEAVILIDDNAAGKKTSAEIEETKVPEIVQVQEVPEKKEESPVVETPFTFTSTQTNVSRYKKEYLQDYIPQEKYVPQVENSLKQKIENPDEVDSKGQTLLMKAAKSGNDWQIKTLLDSGANVNIKDNDGWTALMYACRYQESISTLKTLIEAGAKIKEKNNYDSSALILAASYNDNPEILSYLLKYYTSSEKEVLKCFILLLSSKQSSEYLQIAKVNLFMQKSIPLNTFYQGKTPLMYAAQYGNSTKTLKLLIDNDALTTIRSSEGKTAFDYAAKNSNLVHDENYWALNKK